MEVPPAVQNRRREQERANLPARRRARLRHAPRVPLRRARSSRTRHPHTPTDVITLNANTPLTSGARSRRRYGSAMQQHLVLHVLNPEPRRGDRELLPGRQPAWMGDREKRDPMELHLLDFRGLPQCQVGHDSDPSRARRGLWRPRPEKMQSASLSSHSAARLPAPPAAPKADPAAASSTRHTSKRGHAAGLRPAGASAQPLLCCKSVA